MGNLHNRLRTRFGVVILQLVFGGTVLYNIIAFPSINQADPWRLRQVSSNQLVDLYDMSLAPFNTVWIYPLVDIYYQGKTLLIPERMLDSLPLSEELLQTRGRLQSVMPAEMDGKLTKTEVDLILGMEYVDIRTREGVKFYLITEENDPNSPLLLLKYDNQFFFIPEDLHPDRRGNL